MNQLADKDAERALVGAALLDDTVVDAVALASGCFADGDLRRVWRAMAILRGEGKPLDALLVARRAEVAPSLLSRCAMATLTVTNAEHYAEVVREHALTRAVLTAATELVDVHRRQRVTGCELLDAALKAFTAIDVGQPRCALTIGEIVRERLVQLEEIGQARQNGESYLTGVPTGIDALDNLLGGLQRGIVTMLAGRPAMGKSALALGCADAASAQGCGVHVFSLEDPRAAYADRAMSRVSRVPAEAIRACKLSRSDMAQLGHHTADLVQRQGWLYDDVSDLGAEQLVRAVRRERRDNDTQLVILDYLQLLRRPRRFESIHDAITQNLETLARAAKHDNIAYLVLSQLSRKVEQRTDKRPMMSDLRESGSIEERAKCILGMYRGAYYGAPREDIDYDTDDPDNRKPTDEEWERRVDVLVLKNSNGRTGYIRRKWDGPTTRVY